MRQTRAGRQALVARPTLLRNRSPLLLQLTRARRGAPGRMCGRAPAEGASREASVRGWARMWKGKAERRKEARVESASGEPESGRNARAAESETEKMRPSTSPQLRPQARALRPPTCRAAVELPLSGARACEKTGRRRGGRENRGRADFSVFDGPSPSPSLLNSVDSADGLPWPRRLVGRRRRGRAGRLRRGACGAPADASRCRPASSASRRGAVPAASANKRHHLGCSLGGAGWGGAAPPPQRVPSRRPAARRRAAGPGPRGEGRPGGHLPGRAGAGGDKSTRGKGGRRRVERGGCNCVCVGRRAARVAGGRGRVDATGGGRSK